MSEGSVARSVPRCAGCSKSRFRHQAAWDRPRLRVASPRWPRIKGGRCPRAHSSRCRAVNHFSRALVWHFGQQRLVVEEVTLPGVHFRVPANRTLILLRSRNHLAHEVSLIRTRTFLKRGFPRSGSRRGSYLIITGSMPLRASSAFSAQSRALSRSPNPV
jgi:hypothetical protein